MSQRILVGDVRQVLTTLPGQSVHCCVTSPPYFGLRDYGAPGQIGLESTLAEYVATMVDVFTEVWRVLRDDGTLWLNLGDSYASSGGNGTQGTNGQRASRTFTAEGIPAKGITDGLKPKDLMGVPWRVALALQDDGWVLRSDIIWAKPNPMPESVTDRPTKSHEYLFLLTKQPRYYFDAEAVKEPVVTEHWVPAKGNNKNDATVTLRKDGARHGGGQLGDPSGRNIRSVWTIPTAPFPAAHFATFPPALVEPCIKAGTSERGVCPACGAPWKRVIEKTNERVGVSRGGNYGGVQPESMVKTMQGGYQAGMHYRTIDRGWEATCTCGGEPVPATVLDPFAGAGTTLLVADRLHRNGIGVEINEQYAQMARDRIAADAPMFADVAVEPVMPLFEAAGVEV